MSDRSGFVGTAEEFADLIEDLGENADNDGVLLWGDLHPVTVHRILDELVPILRRRGILRSEFGGGGLRSNLRDF
jgi:alkanesulfonate monooxygenase SsuD/methylene tetrahydromethanopterin reductase-like flavin-dependent oxidoreductase (luciferase family)